MPPRIRCLQTLTAAAVVFAILGACGIPPPRRSPRPIRPRRPSTEITIRSLTGRWEAFRPTSEGSQVLELSLVQRGDTLEATALLGERTLATDPQWPAHLDADGRFVLVFGRAPATVVVRGRPDASGDRIRVTITGLGVDPIAAQFQRR